MMINKKHFLRATVLSILLSTWAWADTPADTSDIVKPTGGFYHKDAPKTAEPQPTAEPEMTIDEEIPCLQGMPPNHPSCRDKTPGSIEDAGQ